MSNLIYVSVDGRPATDAEIDALVINSYPGKSQFDVDFIYPNGKLVDGHAAGFRFQTESERELLGALEEILNTEWLGGKGGFVRARAAVAKAKGEPQC